MEADARPDSETSRQPVIQLLTSQKTIPSGSGTPGGALVSTMER